MGKFSSYACNSDNRNWNRLTARIDDLYKRTEDTRNPFQRDYTRILHSQGYRRLKHKTQVLQCRLMCAEYTKPECQEISVEVIRK